MAARLNHWLVAGVVGLCLAGCSPAPVERPVVEYDEFELIEPAPLKEVQNPANLAINGVPAGPPLVPLGLNADGTHAVPPLDTPQQASWYDLGPRPGEIGPAIVLGHVNGGGQPGVFAGLSEVEAGDEVTVDDKTFDVTEVIEVDKDNFPQDRVYGETEGAEIRLITCGGTLQGDSYDSNIIVFGKLRL